MDDPKTLEALLDARAVIAGAYPEHEYDALLARLDEQIDELDPAMRVTDAMAEAFLFSPLTCPERGDLVTMGRWLNDDAELRTALRAALRASRRG